MKGKHSFILVGKCLLLLSTMMPLHSCTENIDESNFAIKEDQTVAEFIDSHENFSLMGQIFRKVSLGDSDGASSIYNVLTARGNYTIFLATNAAVNDYLASQGLTSINEMTDEQYELIAKSCVIDHRDSSPYETADFPNQGTFSLPNLVDRLLTCELQSDASYLINAEARVVGEDNKTSNGVVHVIDKVLIPSIKKLAAMINETPNLKIFSRLMKETTWCDSLDLHMDMSYENPNRPPVIKLNKMKPYYSIEHRYLGYTALVEPDSVYKEKWGLDITCDEEGNITNWDELLPIIKKNCEAVYGTAAADDMSNPDNAVNRFVAYHLIYGKIPFNRFVWHFNEYMYKYGSPMNPQTVECPTNVWEYYTSMGKYRGIVKITQVGDGGFEHDMEHTMYLNRISEYADGVYDDYHEKGVVDGYAGIKIVPDNGKYDNNALNGFYYPLHDILMYTDGFRNELYHRRMRMDSNTFLTELISNNVRGGIYRAFENYYFKNITRVSPTTMLLYLKMPSSLGWGSFQGDYFLVSGMYDFTLEIPPVPKDGTYEIRMSVVHNSERGMCQIYFGDDPDRLLPVGLPYDMRQQADKDNPALPWEEDTEDLEYNQMIDKNLRNQGYMKSPAYYTICNGQGDLQSRARSKSIRRIITTADMKADKTYYLRYKSALKKTDSQLQIDYIEYASKAVYNSFKGEDIW